MLFSMIALARIYEDELKENKISSSSGIKKPTLSEVRKMDDEIIVKKISSSGWHVEKESFAEIAKSHYSSEQYFKEIMDENKLELTDFDEDFLWLGLTVLWERWFPKVANFEMLDDKITLGYKFLRKNSQATCDIWWEAWHDIIYLMGEHNISDIIVFDDLFRGTQFITNWATDFEDILYCAGNENPQYFEMRIDFCRDYIERYPYQSELNIENMKRAIAESYFLSGKVDEGEKLFARYLTEDPSWGWGWINWSDCYWVLSSKHANDYNKGEELLKKALAIEEVRDREDILERLMCLYNETGQIEAAKDIEKEIHMLQKSKKVVSYNKQIVATKKTGRNDPCPCGSGKKYKKCCGK